MIERKFVTENIKEFRIKEFIGDQLSRVGLSDVKLQRTPLGEKILVKASRPGLVVGRAGSNIQKLTKQLKEKFNLENPQIEIEEIKEVNLDPSIVAEGIASSMERFGTKQFKSAGYRALKAVMDAGALGVEILISGKVPSQRAKTWRFYEGYLKKCGDIAITGVDVAYKTAFLKTGAVGVKVSIMPGDTKLPDYVELLSEPQTIVDEQDGAVALTDEQDGELVAEPAASAESSEKVVKEKKPAKKKSSKATSKKKPKKSSAKEVSEDSDAVAEPVASAEPVVSADKVAVEEPVDETADEKKTGDDK